MFIEIITPDKQIYSGESIDVTTKNRFSYHLSHLAPARKYAAENFDGTVARGGMVWLDPHIGQVAQG